MKWNTAQTYSPANFKRLVGVERSTFDVMLGELQQHASANRKHPRKGVKGKLSMEDKLLMLLMYYREYRTFFHVGSSYGISESQCWRIITGLEKVLLNSSKFHLPGKKKLVQSDVQWEVVLLDVSETPVERPKKNSESIIRAKRKNIP
jgi:hypothetical protein